MSLTTLWMLSASSKSYKKSPRMRGLIKWQLHEVTCEESQMNSRSSIPESWFGCHEQLFFGWFPADEIQLFRRLALLDD